MKINLKSIRKVVEGLLADTCTIVRPSDPTAEELWDEASGTYTQRFLPAELIYSGPCLVAAGGGSFMSQKGGVSYQVMPYTLSLPEGSGPVHPEDLVSITSSESSPQLVDKTFYVDDDAGGTYSVTYIVHMHARMKVPGLSG